MSSKTGLNLTKNYSINFSLPKREEKLINFIIIHYTGMKKESDAIKRLCDSKSNVSSHYFIKNNGKLLNLVPDLYEAWHAGKSSWKTFKSLNKYSVGIEIDNPGHYHGYKEYTSKQILSLEKLLRYLMKRYNIKPQNVLGHSDIAPSRKKDPGEKFPWSKLAKKKLCIWHNLDINKIKDFRKVKLDVYQENIFLKNLKKIGYFEKGKSNDKKMNIVKAFQRKFRQKLINGKIDQECLLISKNLLK
tara:strand:+ start:1111 stop:1845 length:735 start_codon:yes stop_codon:yes gene_type:complete